jgi:dTDP-4-dehydrorhamnose reductase
MANRSGNGGGAGGALPAGVGQPVFLLGARGMLGRAFAEELGRRQIVFAAPRREQLDLSRPETIDGAIPPETRLVINCAGWTDVDGAETHEEEATIVNAIGPGQLATRCAEIDATLVHFSTDYVFDGAASEPYPVDHEPAPVSAYGRSKAAGEQAVVAAGGRGLLIRTSWLYAPWGKNFVRTIARLAQEREELQVVSDQVGRPTSAEGLARSTLGLLEAGAEGVHHACDGGQCSWHEFAGAIVEGMALSCRVEPCTTAEFLARQAHSGRPVAPRPVWSVLDLSKTEAVVGVIPEWRQRLADVLPRLEPERGAASEMKR